MKKQVNITVDENWGLFGDIAEKNGSKRSTLIQQWIKKYIDKYKQLVILFRITTIIQNKKRGLENDQLEKKDTN